jgi:hypothetical protein
MGGAGQELFALFCATSTVAHIPDADDDDTPACVDDMIPP